LCHVLAFACASRVDNVTFVNGKIDPWYWLGLYDTEKATDTMDVLFIEVWAARIVGSR
jgi:hypothetical protein